jgi:hypothetical protein
MTFLLSAVLLSHECHPRESRATCVIRIQPDFTRCCIHLIPNGETTIAKPIRLFAAQLTTSAGPSDRLTAPHPTQHPSTLSNGPSGGIKHQFAICLYAQITTLHFHRNTPTILPRECHACAHTRRRLPACRSHTVFGLFPARQPFLSSFLEMKLYA